MNIGWIAVGILSAIIIHQKLRCWFHVCPPILICSSKMLLLFKSFFVAVLMSSLENGSSNFVWVPLKLAPLVKWHYYHYYWLQSGISSNNTKFQIKPKAGRGEFSMTHLKLLDYLRPNLIIFFMAIIRACNWLFVDLKIKGRLIKSPQLNLFQHCFQL